MCRHLRARLLTLLLAIAAAAVPAAAAATVADQRVTVNVDNTSLRDLFKAIESQTTYRFSYRAALLDKQSGVTLHMANAPVSRVLDAALKGRPLAYEIVSANSIVISEKRACAPAGGHDGRRLTVAGHVYDHLGDPAVGVTVMVKGTANGCSSDIDGAYRLADVAPDATVVFSMVGCTPREIAAANARALASVVLDDSAEELDEVVVVGYGTQKKVNVTGAVAMVRGDVLDSRPVTSAAAGLQGQLPGVEVTRATGQPGAATSIVIRGVSTINSQTSPLVLIDGVAGGDIDLLNPGDIESVSVLKDAASAAIYGARAANGVVLVTTKSGVNEKAKITYSGYAGWQTPTRLPELVNGRQYMELSNEAMTAAGFSAPYTDEAFEKYDSGLFPNEYSNTDWIDAIYKDSALQTGHNLSVRGGNAKTGYFISYGFLKQEGLVVGDSFKSRRHNARMSVNTEVLDRIKVTGNLSFVDFFKSDCGYSGTSGVFRLAQRISPLLPVKWQQENADGTWSDTNLYSFGMVRNPVDVALNSGTEQRKTRTFNGIVGADLRIIGQLHLAGQYSANYYTRETNEFNPAMYQYYSDGTPASGNDNLRNYVSQTQYNYLTQTLQATLKYDQTLAGRHSVQALLGFSQEWEDRSTLSGTRKNILLDDVYVLDAGTEDITNGGNKYEWALRSYFGRVNYAFADKYLFEANLRIDGTSRFNADNRWGYFPSFSGGWNFSRESFMKWARPALASGKLRLSWGELGNQNVSSDYYPYITPIERVDKSYPIGGTNNVGFQQSKLGNPNIKWETIRMFNVGIDLSLFNSRLQASFDWYKKNNIDALVKPVYPTLVGISGSANLPYENMGEIQNKGWELWLQWRDRIGQVKYSLAFNLSDSRNKILDLGTSEPSLGNYIRREGDPIDAYYGYLTDGLAQTSDFADVTADGRYVNPTFAMPKDAEAITQPGDIKYRDISGPDGAPDGVIDDYDKVVFGDKDPHYSYSIKGSLEWRGIDFSFYLQGIGKVKGYLSDEARHCFINDYSVPKVEHLDRWTPTNTGASYPRMYQAQTHNLLFSDYWLEDASYLRMKNIQVGYSLPRKWLAPCRLDKVRVYFSADNLFTISDYFGAYDPELRTSSGDAYPQVKTFIFGLQATF